MIANTDPLRRIFMEKLDAVLPFYRRPDGTIDLDAAILKVWEDWEEQEPEVYRAFLRVAALRGSKTFYQSRENARRTAAKRRNEPPEGDPDDEPDMAEAPGGDGDGGPRSPGKDELDRVFYFPGVKDPIRMGDATPEMLMNLADKLEGERDSKAGWMRYHRVYGRHARSEQLRLGYGEDATLYEIFGYGS